MQLMVEALNLHVISVAWDLQYLTCLAESSRTKIKPMNVTDMNSGTMVTKPGKLFYDTLLVSTLDLFFMFLETFLHSAFSEANCLKKK